MGNAAHLAFGIGHHVPPLTLTIGQRADTLLAEIDVTVELAHDQQVNRAGHFRAQRGMILKSGENPCRAQVGEQPQFLAQPENRLFGPQVPLQPVAFEITDRAEQDGIGGMGGRERLRRQRVAMLAPGRTADIAFEQFEPGQVQGLEHPNRFPCDFRSDAVPGEYCNLHLVPDLFRPAPSGCVPAYPSLSSRSRRMTRAAITSPPLSASA